MATLIIGTAILVLLLAFSIFAIGFAPDLVEAARDDFFIVIVVVTAIALVLLIAGLINVAKKIKSKEDTLRSAGITVDRANEVSYDSALDAKDATRSLNFTNQNTTPQAEPVAKPVVEEAPES